jgi:hypothetical protein
MLLKTKRIDKSIARLRKFLKKNPKRPAPETIHKIRTSARRVESSLDAMDVGRQKLHKLLVEKKYARGERPWLKMRSRQVGPTVEQLTQNGPEKF